MSLLAWSMWLSTMLTDQAVRRGEGGSGRLVTPAHIRTQEMMSPSRCLCAQIKFGGFIISLSVGWTAVGYMISSVYYRWPL